MGILEMHVLMALLLAAIVGASRALRRRRRWPRASAVFMWLAVVTFVAEIVVQIDAWRGVEQAIEARPSEKSVLLARSISLGLNAAALEIVVLLLTLCALGLLAIIRPSSKPGTA